MGKEGRNDRGTEGEGEGLADETLSSLYVFRSNKEVLCYGLNVFFRFERALRRGLVCVDFRTDGLLFATTSVDA